MSDSKDTENKKDELEHEYEYDEEGNLIRAKLNREKLFRDKWDKVIKIQFYSSQHVQRLSMALERCLGVQQKDWDTYVSGYSRVSDVIKHNRKILEDGEATLEEMAKHEFLVGIKEIPANDIEELEYKIKRLKIKYVSDRI